MKKEEREGRRKIRKKRGGRERQKTIETYIAFYFGVPDRLKNR